MKKLISAFTMMFLCSISYAESMKFITVLSSPVGTFNKLEAVDPTSPAYGKTVNFCTNIGTQGVVELKGTKPAALSTVVLSNNTTLGKTDEGKFSLNNITLKQGGSIKGGRLFGNTFTVNNAASGKANNLYGNQLTVAGAKTKTLDVNSGASKINGPGDSKGTEEMVWSNQYQDDDACKSGSACAKQYLLKEKGAVPVGCPDGQYESNGVCCPVGQLSKDGKTCVYAYKPERVNVGILVACHSSAFEDLGAAGASVSIIDNNTCRRPYSVPLSYFVGGKLPSVAAGGGCEAHHAYYNRGKWWEGGEHQGYSLGRCSTSMSDQEFCDSRCTGATCTAKCIISETYPDTCGRYKCSNGRHCDNSSGSGVMLRCVRK